MCVNHSRYGTEMSGFKEYSSSSISIRPIECESRSVRHLVKPIEPCQHIRKAILLDKQYTSYKT